MTQYIHTQVGHLILTVNGALVVFFAWLFWVIQEEVGPNILVGALMMLITFILLSFATLKVTIDEQYLRIKFGYGIFRKKFLLQDITSAKAVKNHWYYGWGIRVWLWPYMLIYNVSGFDAVEITMRNRRIYRIGTDEPGELEAAIGRAVNLR